MRIRPGDDVQKCFDSMVKAGDPEALYEGRIPCQAISPRQVRYHVAGADDAVLCNINPANPLSRCLSFQPRSPVTHLVRGLKFDGGWDGVPKSVPHDQQASIFAQNCKVLIEDCEGVNAPGCFVKVWTGSEVHIINSRFNRPAAGAVQIGGNSAFCSLTRFETDGSVWIEGYGENKALVLSMAHCTLGGKISARMEADCKLDGHDVKVSKLFVSWHGNVEMELSGGFHFGHIRSDDGKTRCAVA